MSENKHSTYISFFHPLLRAGSLHIFLIGCLTFSILFLALAITGTNAQSKGYIGNASVCVKAKKLVQETAAKQGVPSKVMAIESIRYDADSIVVRYSSMIDKPLTPGRLFKAISEKCAQAGFATQVQILSENRILISVSSGSTPCVEMLCITAEPLSTAFYESIAPVPQNVPEEIEAEEMPEQERASSEDLDRTAKDSVPLQESDTLVTEYDNDVNSIEPTEPSAQESTSGFVPLEEIKESIINDALASPDLAQSGGAVREPETVPQKTKILTEPLLKTRELEAIISDDTKVNHTDTAEEGEGETELPEEPATGVVQEEAELSSAVEKKAVESFQDTIIPPEPLVETRQLEAILPDETEIVHTEIIEKGKTELPEEPAIVTVQEEIEPELDTLAEEEAETLPKGTIIQQEPLEENHEAAINPSDETEKIHTEIIAEGEMKLSEGTAIIEPGDNVSLLETITIENEDYSDASPEIKESEMDQRIPDDEPLPADNIPDETLVPEKNRDPLFPSEEKGKECITSDAAITVDDTASPLEGTVVEEPELLTPIDMPEQAPQEDAGATEHRPDQESATEAAVEGEPEKPFSLVPGKQEEAHVSEGESVSEGEPEDSVPVEELPPGKIALILDDGGYGGDTTRRALELSNVLTLAILPDTPFAESTTQKAIAAGFEIMLHMPMQTNGKNAIHAFPGELKLDMTKEDIQKRTRECLDQFPDAVGVNNHTGAGFTKDKERMEWFLEVVKEYEIFFVDSRTTWESCAYDTALEMGIPCAQRTIFLDNSSSPSEIRKYLKELIARARSQGTAVGIGHFRPNTVTVLEEELPKLKAINIELIRVSEVVK